MCYKMVSPSLTVLDNVSFRLLIVQFNMTSRKVCFCLKSSVVYLNFFSLFKISDYNGILGYIYKASSSYQNMFWYNILERKKIGLRVDPIGKPNFYL